MNILKRVQTFSTALIISLASLFVLAVPSASAATITWNGIGTDSNMSNDENWEGFIAPGPGDTIVFPANISNRTVNNDLAGGTSFNSIHFTGSATSASNYTISGNTFSLTNGVTSAMSGDPTSHTISANIIVAADQSWNAYPVTTLTHTGALSGTSSFTKAGTGDVYLNGDKSGFTGPLVVSGGNLNASMGANAFGTSTELVTVSSGASLGLSGFTSDSTFDRPLSLTGSVTVPVIKLAQSFTGSSDATEPPYPTMTFSGDVTLGSNVLVSVSKKNAAFTGTITGAFSINPTEDSVGTLETPERTVNYEDNAPGTTITVGNNQTAVVTGTYGGVDVLTGGILKGTGTVGAVEIFSGGTIAPGLSPGCLSTGDLTFHEGGIYDFELGGTTACTQYDQIKVTGSVTLGNGTLNTEIVNDFKPAAGQSFTIINNDGTDAIGGTFKDLAEGATFELAGTVFKISYVGGDGNDVVLSVQSVPETPDTGWQLLSSNPLMAVLTATAAAGALLVISRRFQKTK